MKNNLKFYLSTAPSIVDWHWPCVIFYPWCRDGRLMYSTVSVFSCFTRGVPGTPDNNSQRSSCVEL